MSMSKNCSLVDNCLQLSRFKRRKDAASVYNTNIVTSAHAVDNAVTL